MGMQFESSNEADKAINHYLLGVQAGDSASSYVSSSSHAETPETSLAERKLMGLASWYDDSPWATRPALGLREGD